MAIKSKIKKKNLVQGLRNVPLGRIGENKCKQQKAKQLFTLTWNGAKNEFYNGSK